MPPNLLLDRLNDALADRYEVQREIGKGGSATVYQALDFRHERSVAIKVLSPELRTGVNPQRFLSEVRTAANLQHPHILPLFDSGEADGLLYYTMPFVEGVTLHDHLAANGPLDLEEFLAITREVGDALAYAHKQGFVHRDVKPSNILLSSGHALLADFGLARAVSGTVSAGLTSSGMILGTGYYMSPEQASGESDIDHRSDIYSLGCVCFEMLTGERPYTGSTFVAVLAGHVMKEVPSVQEGRPEISDGVAGAVSRAMAKDPADRFASAEEFLASLPGTSEVLASLSSGGPRPPPRSAVTSLPSVRAGVSGVLILTLLLVVYQAFKPPSAPNETPRLVVLPFEHLGDTTSRFFTDGITEEVIGRLGSVGQLAVVGRLSAMQYRDTDKSLSQIAEELGVDYVVNGSVQWSEAAGSGPEIRIRPSLIRTSDGEQVWFQSYEAQLDDVFSVQSSIAQRVVEALGLALLEPQRTRLTAVPTNDVGAYQLLLQGNDYYDRSRARPDVETAVRLYREATERDPAFAHAFASLGRAHAWMYRLGYDLSEDRVRDAAIAVDSALSLDPNLPEAHLAQGYYHYWTQGDYELALDHFERASTLKPSDADPVNAMGNIRRRQGDFAEALAEFEKATEIDPRTARAWYNLGGTRLFLRQFDAAETALNRAIALAPDNTDAYLHQMRVAIGRDGDLGEVRRLLARAEAEVGPSRWGVSPRQMFRIAYDADEAFRRTRPGDFGLDTTGYHIAMGEALDLISNTDSARVHWETARTRLEDELAEGEDHYSRRAHLGLAFAALGRREDALREARLATELLPVTRDAFDGPENLINLARVYALVGDGDAAVEQLEFVLSIPSWLTRGLLRSDPAWGLLRDHPGFGALLLSPRAASIP